MIHSLRLGTSIRKKNDKNFQMIYNNLKYCIKYVYGGTNISMNGYLDRYQSMFVKVKIYCVETNKRFMTLTGCHIFCTHRNHRFWQVYQLKKIEVKRKHDSASCND